MLAITKQTTLDDPPGTCLSDTVPSVVYSSENQIDVTVIVSPDLEDQALLNIQAPPIAIFAPRASGSILTVEVTWHFIPAPGAMFDEVAVLPPRELGTQSVENNLSQHQVTKKLLIPSMGLSAFSYDLTVSNSQSGTGRTIHDPTIVVAPEPIG